MIAIVLPTSGETSLSTIPSGGPMPGSNASAFRLKGCPTFQRVSSSSRHSGCCLILVSLRLTCVTASLLNRTTSPSVERTNSSGARWVTMPALPVNTPASFVRTNTTSRSGSTALTTKPAAANRSTSAVLIILRRDIASPVPYLWSGSVVRLTALTQAARPRPACRSPCGTTVAAHTAGQRHAICNRRDAVTLGFCLAGLGRRTEARPRQLQRDVGRRIDTALHGSPFGIRQLSTRMPSIG